MGASKKGIEGDCGMKANLGVVRRGGLVHTAGGTTGGVHDAKVMDC